MIHLSLWCRKQTLAWTLRGPWWSCTNNSISEHPLLLLLTQLQTVRINAWFIQGSLNADFCKGIVFTDLTCSSLSMAEGIRWHVFWLHCSPTLRGLPHRSQFVALPVSLNRFTIFTVPSTKNMSLLQNIHVIAAVSSLPGVIIHSKLWPSRNTHL